jgi:hypothetical protein
MRSFAWSTVRTQFTEGEPPGSWLNGEDYGQGVHRTPLTTDLLRHLNISGIIREAKRFGADLHALTAALTPIRRAEALEQAAAWEQSLERKGGGPRVNTPERLRKVAEIYRGALDRGDPPTKAVAEKLHCSPPHAGRLVGMARKAGFLGPTRKGKAGP